MNFGFSFFYLKNGITPLHIAAQNGHEQIVQLLLEKGKPNVNLVTKVLLLIAFLCLIYDFILWEVGTFGVILFFF